MKKLATIYKALSDETRLAMLGLVLKEGELCVCEFVEVLGITQSKASRHLRYLVNVGLFDDRREGLWVYYALPKTAGSLRKGLLRDLRRFLPAYLPDSFAKALTACRTRMARADAHCTPDKPAKTRSGKVNK